ncbi:ATP-binding cassette domain-containing protein [Emticicia sp. CRIBPO]|uniref:peptidase domain-containing ABC transporter n=1 Tax=Emticicia sp. CRIBPO TaxID=2683258 RepID=UPI0014127D52|nr:peptidase domain-containing ABC transporter [Emticicia sp. CRIBPO]NBA87283.1 ATP-binding cassette domain-containing protein [Emticicia sp. CRIBPO]
MNLKPLFIPQRDQTDCGVTCLLSVIRMHGGDASLETLRIQSGTSLQGTTLLGLQQAASIYHLHAEAFEVDEPEVFKKEATFPCILHVVIDQKLEHYVICNGINNNGFEIIDPAQGIETWSETELLQRWQSRAVLILNPGEGFEKTEQTRSKKILWIKALIKDDQPLLGIAVALGILIAVLGMITAVFSQKLIDEILPKQQTTKLWMGLALLFILLMARAGFNYLRSYFLIRQSKDFNNRIMDDFYEKLLQLPKTFFDTRKTGEIIARLSDTRRIQTVISFLAGNVIIDILISLVSAGFLFYYSWSIALLSLLGIPLFGGLVWAYHDRIIAAQKMVMSQYAATESFFVDTVGGINVIKSGNKESFFQTIGKKVYSFFQEKIYRLGRLGTQYALYNEIINALMISLILAFASYQILQKDLKTGEMMAVLSIAVGMLSSLSKLATTNIQIQEAKVAFDRMYEFAETEPEIKTIRSEAPGKIDQIEFRNVSFRFPGKSPLLKNVSLTLRKGQLTTLTGEVGSGKSLVLQILQKFQKHDAGLIVINSETGFNTIPVETWRNSIGVLHQDTKIFNGTLLDNIILGDVAAEAEKAIEYCRKYGFSYFFEVLPQGYLTILGEDGVKLSGGQKQLLALARALYHNPEVLLLDEPTSAMDKKTEAFVMTLLESIKPDKIILMVSHRDTLSKYSDKTYVLQKGEVLNDIKEESVC